jgi:hypothetical protein
MQVWTLCLMQQQKKQKKRSPKRNFSNSLPVGGQRKIRIVNGFPRVLSQV